VNICGAKTVAAGNVGRFSQKAFCNNYASNKFFNNGAASDAPEKSCCYEFCFLLNFL